MKSSKKNYKSYANIKTKIEELEELPDASENETAPVAWPVYPIKKILRYFGDSDFEKAF
ncbi:hypothetical protein IJM86_07015 [bacterium]|nr:hypothetical protein [bacterium]